VTYVRACCIRYAEACLHSGDCGTQCLRWTPLSTPWLRSGRGLLHQALIPLIIHICPFLTGFLDALMRQCLRQAVGDLKQSPRQVFRKSCLEHKLQHSDHAGSRPNRILGGVRLVCICTSRTLIIDRCALHCISITHAVCRYPCVQALGEKHMMTDA
jgi:hypothetical protein